MNMTKETQKILNDLAEKFEGLSENSFHKASAFSYRTPLRQVEMEAGTTWARAATVMRKLIGDARDEKEGKAVTERYRIWSIEHRQWWRPARHGYTSEASEAGLYSKDEAIEICTGIFELNEVMVPEYSPMPRGAGDD